MMIIMSYLKLLKTFVLISVDFLTAAEAPLSKQKKMVVEIVPDCESFSFFYP